MEQARNENSAGGESAPRRGIILAAGANTRLYPATLAIPKSLLPVYDKPLIYYPLTTLFLAGIRDILIITTPAAQAAHQRLLQDGTRWGVSFSYQTQSRPRGIADAFLLGADFIAGAPCALALADNIFYGRGLEGDLRRAAAETAGATVFTSPVANPHNFGVAEFAADGKVLSLEEKPAKPKSSSAVVGCYFYDETVCGRAAELQPSARGELEITDLNRLYLQCGKLRAQPLANNTAWFDAGSAENLATAADFVRKTQQADNRIIASPEEAAWRNGWMSDAELLACAEAVAATGYGSYLRELSGG